jgi:hypothetical protein
MYRGVFNERIQIIIRVSMSKRIRWGGHVARKGENRNAYSTMVGKLERMRPLGMPRCRWLDIIKMDLERESLGWY